MTIIKNLFYVLFAITGFLVYKNIIPTNIFVLGYTYLFIMYMLYHNVKKKHDVNVKVFAGIMLSLLGISYMVPFTNNLIIGITMFILAYFTVINLIRYIKVYDAKKEENSYPVVVLSSLMIVMLYLLIFMKMFD